MDYDVDDAEHDNDEVHNTFSFHFLIDFPV